MAFSYAMPTKVKPIEIAASGPDGSATISFTCYADRLYCSTTNLVLKRDPDTPIAVERFRILDQSEGTCHNIASVMGRPTHKLNIASVMGRPTHKLNIASVMGRPTHKLYALGYNPSTRKAILRVFRRLVQQLLDDQKVLGRLDQHRRKCRILAAAEEVKAAKTRLADAARNLKLVTREEEERKSWKLRKIQLALIK